MAGGVSQVGITLGLQQSLGKGTVWLSHPHNDRVIRVRSPACDKPTGDINLHSASIEYIQQAVVFTIGQDKCEQLAVASRPDRLLPNLIKPAQPLIAILRSMSQQQKRRGRHVVCDVADVPFTAFPDRAEVWGFFSRVVVLAGAEVFEFDGYRRRKLCRRGFG